MVILNHSRNKVRVFCLLTFLNKLILTFFFFFLIDNKVFLFLQIS